MTLVTGGVGRDKVWLCESRLDLLLRFVLISEELVECTSVSVTGTSSQLRAKARGRIGHIGFCLSKLYVAATTALFWTSTFSFMTT